jgi:hypothetical protein
MQMGLDCRLCYQVQDALTVGRLHEELQNFAAWVFDKNPAKVAEDPLDLIEVWREEYTRIPIPG